MMDTPQVLHYSELEVVPPTDALAQKYAHSSSLEYQHNQAPPQARIICGLRPTTFFLVLALILVILAAGLGGGVGGAMAVKNAKSAPNNVEIVGNCPTPTATYISSICAATSSLTTSSIITVPTAGLLALDCPKIENTNVSVTSRGLTFLFSVTCGEDFGSSTGREPDILAIISYSLQDCAQACASYNLDQGQNICKGATFNSDLTRSVAANFGTCFLKNDTAGQTQGTDNSYAGLLLK